MLVRFLEHHQSQKAMLRKRQMMALTNQKMMRVLPASLLQRDPVPCTRRVYVTQPTRTLELPVYQSPLTLTTGNGHAEMELERNTRFASRLLARIWTTSVTILTLKIQSALFLDLCHLILNLNNLIVINNSVRQ